LGIVTWPLRVSVVSMASTLRYYSISNCNTEAEDKYSEKRQRATHRAALDTFMNGLKLNV
jgi:hypothetical protein